MSGNNIAALFIIGLFMLIPLAMGAVAGKKSIPTTEDFFYSSIFYSGSYLVECICIHGF